VRDKIAYTPFQTLKEAEEFASELSGETFKVVVVGCSCGCGEADVFSVPPGMSHPTLGHAILRPGPYNKEKDLSFTNFNS
jgi:hypothetical protein